MNASQRVHWHELQTIKHLAVHEAYQKNPKEPDFSKSWFIEFMIQKYEKFLAVSRETIGA